jgi:hypothetical protein
MAWSKTSRIEWDLMQLSMACPLSIYDAQNVVIVKGLKLPAGYNASTTNLFLNVPPDYPLSPPGIDPYPVFLPAGLKYHSRTPNDYHENRQPNFTPPGWGSWAWFCFQDITWDPRRDNFIRFIEMVRADLSSP